MNIPCALSILKNQPNIHRLFAAESRIGSKETIPVTNVEAEQPRMIPETIVLEDHEGHSEF